jgi:hypothetical protein
MNRLRPVFGIAAGIFLIVSSVAHSILGWRSMAERLAATNAPSDLQNGLRVGWQFGGAVMLALGVMVIHIFVGRLKGEARSLAPVAIVSVTYLAFGAWAAAATGGDPFFLLFLVPGLLLGLAANQRG